MNQPSDTGYIDVNEANRSQGPKEFRITKKKKKVTSSLFSSGSNTMMALENLYPNIMLSIISDIINLRNIC